MSFLHCLEYSPIKAADLSVKIYLFSLKVIPLVVRKLAVFFQSLTLAQFRMILLTKKIETLLFLHSIFRKALPTHKVEISTNETDVDFQSPRYCVVYGRI